MPSKQNSETDIVIIVFMIVVLFFVIAFMIWKRIASRKRIAPTIPVKPTDDMYHPLDLGPHDKYNLDISDEKLLIRKENDMIYDATMVMGETIIGEKNIFDPIHYTKIEMSPYVSQIDPEKIYM